MTHNIIHDEKENLWVEVMDDYIRTAELGLYALEQKRHKEEMRGHFEKLWNWHIKSLIKHVDSEIERLEEDKDELSRKYPHENKLWQTITDGSLIALTHQITHLQSLKAELTKSK